MAARAAKGAAIGSNHTSPRTPCSPRSFLATALMHDRGLSSAAWAVLLLACGARCAMTEESAASASVAGREIEGRQLGHGLWHDYTQTAEELGYEADDTLYDHWDDEPGWNGVAGSTSGFGDGWGMRPVGASRWIHPIRPRPKPPSPPSPPPCDNIPSSTTGLWSTDRLIRKCKFYEESSDCNSHWAYCSRWLADNTHTCNECARKYGPAAISSSVRGVNLLPNKHLNLGYAFGENPKPTQHPPILLIRHQTLLRSCRPLEN